MPTRKQRRRQEKSRRHEYEYVWVDDEGNEVEVDAEELPARAAANKDAKPTRDRRGRPVRKIEPPSWQRVGKRALIFAPIMFAVVWILRPEGATAATAVVQTVVLLGFFLPFSYLMDSMMYRSYLRRTNQAPAKDGEDGRLSRRRSARAD